LWAGFIRGLERLFVRRCAAVITVSDGIADRLREFYGLARAPTVVRNLSDLPSPDGTPGLRTRLGVPADTPLILHQGAPAPGRGCEDLVRALARVARAHVVFLGDPDPGYDQHLRDVAQRAGVAPRVHLHPSVAPERLLSYTADADLGVSLLEDTCENHRLALPNKVFEYVAAGIPVLARGLPELSTLVEREQIGWVSTAFDTLDEALRTCLEHAADADVGARLVRAQERLTWAKEREALLRVYDELARPATALRNGGNAGEGGSA
jgi:glycosyltransferase involved in cell wall biosynthesis